MRGVVRCYIRLQSSQSAHSSVRVPSVTRLTALLGPKQELSATHALAVAANVYLNFISLADMLPKTTDARRAAVTRYLRFRTLWSLDQSLVPALDIAIVWATDMMQPQSFYLEGLDRGGGAETSWYAHQHMRLLQSGLSTEVVTGPFRIGAAAVRVASWTAAHVALFGVSGMVSYPVAAAVGATVGSILALGVMAPVHGVKATPAFARFEADNDGIVQDGIVSAEERAAVVHSWLQGYKRSASKWRQKTRTPYNTRSGIAPHALPVEPSQAYTIARLLKALESQERFHRRILSLGPRVIDAAYIDAAVERYAHFLGLASDHPGKTLVPTLDIDLIWHAHMCSPLDYVDDCRRILGGRVLAHDTGLPQAKLDEALVSTDEHWRGRYGADYRRAPLAPPRAQGDVAPRASSVQAASAQQSSCYSPQSNNSPPAAACGSCGWGNDSWHVTLRHHSLEQRMLDGMHPAGSPGDSHHLDTWAARSSESAGVETSGAAGDAADSVAGRMDTDDASFGIGTAGDSWGTRSRLSGDDAVDLWGGGDPSSHDGRVATRTTTAALMMLRGATTTAAFDGGDGGGSDGGGCGGSCGGD